MERTIQHNLTDKEYELVLEFQIRHRQLHGKDQSVSGGRFSFKIHPTGIGTAVEIVCNQCKRKKDVTEYESW